MNFAINVQKIIQNSLCIQIKGLKLHNSRRKQKKKNQSWNCLRFMRQNPKVPLKKIISKWKSSN